MPSNWHSDGACFLTFCFFISYVPCFISVVAVFEEMFCSVLRRLLFSNGHFVFFFSVQLCIWGGGTWRALSYVCELP